MNTTIFQLHPASLKQAKSCTRQMMQQKRQHIKPILHATVLDIKVYHYPRNIAIPRVVINLISNTIKVQYLFYYIHYTCIQNRVRAMKTERPRYVINENATVTVHTWLAPTCVSERRHCQRVKNWRVIVTSDLPRVCERMSSTRDPHVSAFTLEQRKRVDIQMALKQ